MSPVILFGALLLLSFGVILWVLKPTKPEVDVRRHLSGIEKLYGSRNEATTILKQEALSSVPWLNEILQQIPGALKLKHFIQQAGSTWDLTSLVLGSAAIALAVTWLVNLWISVITVAIAFGAAAASAPYVYLAVKRAIRLGHFDQLLPEAIDLMTRGLRAGHALTAVIEMVAEEIADPVGSEFRIVFEEQNLGLPIREAILNLVRRVPLEDVRFLAAAMLVQKETGGNLVEILEKTGVIMRERMRLRGQLRIYTAQGRVTGWILCSLPFGVFGIISLVNPSYERTLLSDPLVVHLVYAGLVMMGLGLLVIRKIIDIRV